MEYITKEHIACLENKAKFVENVSKAIVGTRCISVEELSYKFFVDKYGRLQEFLIISYKGGAHAARACTATSELGIFTEISKYLDSGAPSGYYDGYDCYNFYLSELADSVPVSFYLEPDKAE